MGGSYPRVEIDWVDVENPRVLGDVSVTVLSRHLLLIEIRATNFQELSTYLFD